MTAAASRLGVSKAVVSKQLQLLEEEVGVSLLARNTRSLQPTVAGKAFYETSKVMLDQAHSAFESAREFGGAPSGELRVTASIDLGVNYIAPLASQFCLENTKVMCDLVFSDEQKDLVNDRFDMSFRVGWLKDSTNRARKLTSFREIVVCSPELLQQHTINSPEDLAVVPFISNSAIPGESRWQFYKGESVSEVTFDSVLKVNVTLGVGEAVKAGGCVAILPDFIAAKDLQNKQLVRLVPDWALREGGIYVLNPPGQLRSGAAQAFLDYVIANTDNGRTMTDGQV